MTQELPLEPVSSSTCTLYHGDCLEVLPTLPPKVVQMVFADLPYGITRNHWDIPINPAEFWGAIKGVSTDSSKIILTATQPFASVMVHSNLKNFKYDLIWDKKRVTGFLNARHRPMRRHEHVLIFSSQSGVYNPVKTKGNPRYLARKGTSSNYGNFVTREDSNLSGERHPHSIISAPSVARRSQHPTEKPISLLDWLIQSYSNSSDFVLDPVAGSGVTGVAAARLGRNCILIEKEKTYFDIMHERIASERARLGLTPPTIG